MASAAIVAELIFACEVWLPDGAFRLDAPEVKEAGPGLAIRQEEAEPYCLALVQNVLYVQDGIFSASTTGGNRSCLNENQRVIGIAGDVA